jgi:hypothetical protein
MNLSFRKSRQKFKIPNNSNTDGHGLKKGGDGSKFKVQSRTAPDSGTADDRLSFHRRASACIGG